MNVALTYISIRLDSITHDFEENKFGALDSALVIPILGTARLGITQGVFDPLLSNPVGSSSVTEVQTLIAFRDRVGNHGIRHMRRTVSR